MLNKSLIELITNCSKINQKGNQGYHCDGPVKQKENTAYLKPGLHLTNLVPAFVF
jgi:hypothetical protein